MTKSVRIRLSAKTNPSKIEDQPKKPEGERGEKLRAHLRTKGRTLRTKGRKLRTKGTKVSLLQRWLQLRLLLRNLSFVWPASQMME